MSVSVATDPVLVHFRRTLDAMYGDRIEPVVTDILFEDGAFIHAMPYRAGAYEDRSPLMHEIRREGLDL